MKFIHIIIVCVFGILLGFFSMKLTDKLIADRMEPGMEAVNIKNSFSSYLWGTAMAVVATAFYLMGMSRLLLIEGMLIVCICACLSMTDISIRRVPNQLLLALLCLKMAKIVLGIICNKKFEIGMLTGPIIGLLLAYLVFIFPVRLGISIGAGDVKFAAVVGFYYGLYGFLQTMAIAGIGVFIYYLYLRIAKKVIGSLLWQWDLLYLLE